MAASGKRTNTSSATSRTTSMRSPISSHSGTSNQLNARTSRKPGENTRSRTIRTAIECATCSKSSKADWQTGRSCAVIDCTRERRGNYPWCNAHFQRWYKTGDPMMIRPSRWQDYETPTCSVNGCIQPAHARGLCAVHGPRMRRYGSPVGGRRQIVRGSDEERFATFVAEQGTCLVWIGATTSAGYGEFQVDGKTVYAHRWAYEHYNGPIPKGSDVHHKCQNESCVRADHLIALTRSEHKRWHRDHA